MVASNIHDRDTDRKPSRLVIFFTLAFFVTTNRNVAIVAEIREGQIKGKGDSL